MKRSIYLLSILLIFLLPARAQWQLMDTTNMFPYLNVHFHDNSNGIVSGGKPGSFLTTTNGGQSWDTVKVPYLDQMTDFRRDMQFVNKNIGFACGGSGFSMIQSILMRTTNGGQTWDSVTTQIPAAIEPTGVDFKFSNNGLKGIMYGYTLLLRSVDSGKTLVQVNNPVSSYTVNSAAYLGDSTILVTGMNHLANTIGIYKSDNWGNTWQLVHTDTLEISSLVMSGNNGIGCSWKGFIVQTTDGGNSWTRTKIAGEDVAFTKARYGANGYIYLLATNFTYSKGYIYGSDNNGKSWHSVLVDTSNQLIDISMPSTGTGYVITNHKLYKTTTGGGLGLQVSNIPNAAKDVKIYPNPASGWLNIEASPSVEIRAMSLYDNAGKCVGTWEGQRQRINVAGFAKGIYHMRIETSEGAFVKKLLLE